ncbi:MAG: hypothetical protein K6V97_11400 [Actinomycetia bacterium]|nr:hypothetical protein [Actinomycetes bacterium]
MRYPRGYPALEFHLNQLFLYVAEQYDAVGNLGTSDTWIQHVRAERKRIEILGDKDQVAKDLGRISERDFRDLAMLALGIRLTDAEASRLLSQLRAEWA